MIKKIYFSFISIIGIIISILTFVNLQASFESSPVSNIYVFTIANVFCLLSNIGILAIALKNKVVQLKHLIVFLLFVSAITNMSGFLTLSMLLNTLILVFIKPNESEKEDLEKINSKNLEKLEILQTNKKGYILSFALIALYAIVMTITKSITIPKNFAIPISITLSLSFMALSLVFFWPTFKRDFIELKNNFASYSKHIFNSYVIFMLFYYLVMIVYKVIAGDIMPANEDNLSKLPALYTAFAAIFYAPLVEESIFRCSIRKLIKNEKLFILISTITFASIHIIQDPNAIITVIPYLAIALALSISYTRKNNMCVNISIHALNNLLATYITFLHL